MRHHQEPRPAGLGTVLVAVPGQVGQQGAQAFDVGVVITIESSLSFIGLGVQPPTPSLGALISEGQRYLQTNPSLTIFPALAIFLLVAGIQFASQSLGARRGNGR